jgi:hypothetical protein
MMKKNNVAILVAAFLGEPETIQSKLTDRGIRYLHTKNAFLAIKNKLENQSLYLGLVGDESECNRLIAECNLNENNAKWFDQDRALISRGTGALENQLIVKCIKNWSLEKKLDAVIKVTGKYEILNLNKVINFSQVTSQPFCAWRTFSNNMVDTRVLIFNPKFYLQNQIELEKINSMPGFWMENIAFNLMRKRNFSFGYLSYRPILNGLAGTANQFSTTPLYKRVLINCFTYINIIFASALIKLKLIFGKHLSE